MRFSDRVDENSLSYIRGRYGRDSTEYAMALKNNGVVISRKSTNLALSEKEEVKSKPLNNETPLQYARRMKQEKLNELK